MRRLPLRPWYLTPIVSQLERVPQPIQMSPLVGIENPSPQNSTHSGDITAPSFCWQQGRLEISKDTGIVTNVLSKQTDIGCPALAPVLTSLTN